MKFQAVKSFNAHQNSRESIADFKSLSEALSYIRDTSDGHVWAWRQVVFDERIGYRPAELCAHEVKDITDIQALLEIEDQFASQSIKP